VTTSSKTGPGGLDWPHHRQDYRRLPPLKPSAGDNSGNSSDRREALSINGVINPTAAAVEAAGRLADLAEYIAFNCQVCLQDLYLFTVSIVFWYLHKYFRIRQESLSLELLYGQRVQYIIVYTTRTQVHHLQ
jgi:hypothetical protein